MDSSLLLNLRVAPKERWAEQENMSGSTSDTTAFVCGTQTRSQYFSGSVCVLASDSWRDTAGSMNLERLGGWAG